jgi:hypothetical protein
VIMYCVSQGSQTFCYYLVLDLLKGFLINKKWRWQSSLFHYYLVNLMRFLVPCIFDTCWNFELELGFKSDTNFIDISYVFNLTLHISHVNIIDRMCSPNRLSLGNHTS